MRAAFQEIETHESRRKRFRPYPAHRESGIRWLGSIPEHWTVQRLKHIASIRTSNIDKKSDDDELPVRLCNYIDVYHRDYITDGVPFMQGTASPDEIRRFRLIKGDVLITKDSEEWNDIAVPAYVDEELDGVVCGYHLAQVRPHADEAYGEYLFRAFAAHAIRDQFRIAANGITRFGLSKYAIATALFPVPPIDEQQAIAEFLRRETARIDALIAKKERLIELLHEKRAALISHAVTRGLDPDAPMNDSGVEWLGQIPNHWLVLPLRRVLRRIEQGWSPECENRPAESGEWGVLKSGCVNKGHLDATENKALPRGLSPDASLQIREGDVLMSRACGSRHLIGSVAYVSTSPDRLLLCDKLFRLYASPTRLLPTFLSLTLTSRASRAQVEVAISGADGLANNITQGTIRSIQIGLPPLDEQHQIVDYAKETRSAIDSLVAKVTDALDRLREYRSALISAAVTGKIDVREESSCQP